MGWWKADPSPPAPAPVQVVSQTPATPPTSKGLTPSCPVDEKTRAIWLKQHAKSPSQTPPIPPSHPPIPPPPAATFASTPSTQCSSDTITQSPSTHPSPPTTSSRPLSHTRVISSIPRASPTPTNPPTQPSNSESETGYDPTTGNWIYPSEHQFFTAVLRKHSLPASSSDPNTLASTIPSIIPIHNAVNERAWTLIKSWEGSTSSRCGGPKLLSFRGLGAGSDDEPGFIGGLVSYARLLDPRTTLSPRARLTALGGYQAPFDRHDWVVERCGGEKVEYVIDFYQGKGGASTGLNFYLDVRPKLNSWEGWRMRGARFWGWRRG